MSDSLSSRRDVRNRTAEAMNKSSNGFNSLEEHAGIDVSVIINCVLNAPLILISILGNSMVLVAIIRTPSIRSNSMIMLCSLVVSDLLVGFIAQPLYIAAELSKTYNPAVLSFNLSKMTVIALCGVSLCTITAITVDRFMALHYHMRYASLVTESRVKCTVVLIWLTNIVLSSFQLWNERALNLSTAVVIVLCLNISTFCYVKIHRIVRQHQLQIHAQQHAVESFNLGNNLYIARMRRSAINTFIFYIVLILCYFPINVLLLTFNGVSYKNWKSGYKFATTVVFMNSSINPFLYCWRLGELRTAVVHTTKELLCKRIGQD